MKRIKRLAILCSISLMCLLGNAAAQPAHAAPSSRPLPVSEFLNADGTLDLTRGLSGSLDLRGWEVRLDSNRGPVLASPEHSTDPEQARETVSSQTATDTWHSLTDNGLDAGPVYALAVMGSDLYVGGFFFGTNDESVSLNHIAKFSGGTWSPLPDGGLNGPVQAFAVSGNDLYVGGDFSQTFDGAVQGLNGIAKLSGGVWSALPDGGFNTSNVRALAFNGSDLYVGGQFSQTADGAVQNLNQIAKFSNVAWSALPNNGLNCCFVNAFAVIGSDLYVGGDFSQTYDGSVQNLNAIAKLSSGLWSPLPGNGLSFIFPGPGLVYALAVSGSDLYVGGSFYQVADGRVKNLGGIAKLSGGKWSALPHKGLSGSGVNALAVKGSNLYVAGNFSETGDHKVLNLNSIAKFSGGKWSALPDHGLDSYATALAVMGCDTYVGGNFFQTFDQKVKNLNSIALLQTGLPAGTYQDNNRAVNYSGVWTSTKNSKASVGTFASSNQTGAQASLCVTGASTFKVTTIKGPDRGIATVLVDGVDVGTFDGYAAKVTYGASMGPFLLPDTGEHTVALQVSGSKNPSSSNYTVVLDKYVVSP
jgi:hypothetical protein